MHPIKLSLGIGLMFLAAPLRAEIEEVWRQPAQVTGALVAPDGPAAMFVAYTVDFADGSQVPQPTRTISGVTFTNSSGVRAFMIARYDAAGALQWIRQIGSAPRSPYGGEVFPYSSINRLRIDANRNLWICGNVAGGTPTTLGADQFQSSHYYGNPYIAKLDSEGNLLWTRFVTGTDASGFDGLAVDSSGNAFVCGQLYGRQTFGATEVLNTGGNRPFVAKIDGNGNWQWVQAERSGQVGGWAFGVATDAAGNPYITGYMGGGADSGNTFFGLPFPKAGESPFVAKFNGSDGSALWVTNAPCGGFYALSNIGREIAVASDGSAYVAGHFYGPGRFGDTTLTSLPYADGDVTFFLARISANGQWLWATMGEATPRALSAATGLAVDAQDNAWVQGYTAANYFYGAGTDGRITLAGATLTNTSFIAKANPQGTFLMARRTRSAGPIVAWDADGYTCWGGDTGAGNGLIRFGPATAPAITAEPLSATAPLSTPITLTATVTGSPVYYQWRKEGVGIGGMAESFSTNGTHTIRLTIGNFQPSDIAGYTLIASNSAGAVTSIVASLSAPVPAITGVFNLADEPVSSVPPGSTIVIRGENLTGATAATLGVSPLALFPVVSDTQIKALVPVHFLNDPVTVVTPGGVANSPGTLVAALPASQSAQTNRVGGVQNFATGVSTNFTYQWFKDGLPLTDDTRISGATSPFLSIIDLQLSDGGDYHVVTRAGERVAQSADLSLAVLPQPPNLTITGSSFTSGATAGDVAAFSVTAQGDNPVSYQWFKDGLPLADDTRISGSASASLHITNLQTNDSGTYFVVLTVESGSVRGSDMPLLVTVPVQIQSTPQNQFLFPGSNVTFAASATGSLPLGYQWRKDGVPLADGSRITGATTLVLTISDLVPTDAGTYSLLVSNSTSSAAASANLVPIGPPTIAVQPQGQAGRVGYVASLFVFANGFPPLNYQWLRDGVPLAGQTNASLNLSPLRLNDTGGYSVAITNLGGSVTSAVATLTVTSRSNLFHEANVAWVRQAGSSQYDRGQAIALDSTGNVFVAGVFSDTFAQSLSTAAGQFGSHALPANGRRQFFVTKLNSEGETLWARTAEGTAEHEAFAVATDSGGNVLVSGGFNGTAVFGSTALTSAGAEDVFLAKLDGNGNFLWAIQAGRTNRGYGAALEVDASNDIWWAGTFQGRLTLGANTLVSAGGDDIFLARVSADGQAPWAERYGGTGNDMVWSLRSQPGAGNLFMAGDFTDTTTLGGATLSSSASRSVFLAKLDGQGTVLYARAAGTPGFNQGLGVAADGTGAAYLTGSSTAGIFSAGALTVTNHVGAFGFLLKLDPAGEPQWLRKINESGGGQALALDAAGNPVIGGWLTLADSDQEVFLARFDPEGNPLGTAAAGGAGFDLAEGIAIGAGGALYVTGYFDAAGLGGATFGTNSLGGLGSSDIFVAKLAGLTHQPLRIHSLTRQANGVTRLLFGHLEHSPLDVNRRLRLKVLATGDLSLPRGAWQQLTGLEVTEEGELRVDDPDAAGLPRRFYLVVEEP